MMSREAKNQVPSVLKPRGSRGALGKGSTPDYILLGLPCAQCSPWFVPCVRAKLPVHFVAVNFFTSWSIVSSGGLS